MGFITVGLQEKNWVYLRGGEIFWDGVRHMEINSDKLRQTDLQQKNYETWEELRQFETYWEKLSAFEWECGSRRWVNYM